MHTKFAFLFAGLALTAVAQVAAAAGCAVRSGEQLVPLVELYTSEGCSSCPPADRWLSTQHAKPEANFLAFHVDYWDDIGWPDRFASSAFSQRQRKRVGAAGGSTVYTPQVMLGANVRANWHDAGAWTSALRQAKSTPPGAELALTLAPASKGMRATVSATPRGAGSRARLWLAEYADGQSTAVKAGENRGATLKHDRVVRRLSGPWSFDDKGTSRSILVGGDPETTGLTAFVQDSDGRVLQSLDLDLAKCDSVPAPGT